MTVFEKIGELWDKYRDLVIKTAMISLAAVTTTFVYLFQRPVMPDGLTGDIVAGASAVSLVLIYVGLAVARLDEGRRKRVMWVAVAAAAIETIYGTIHVAIEIYNKNNPGSTGLLDGLPGWVAWLLGFLHAAPFSILLFLVAQFVFHDPTKDQHFLDQLKAALATIEERVLEIAGLKDALDQKSWEIERLQSEMKSLHTNNGELKGIIDRDRALYDSNNRDAESNNKALRNELLLLRAQLEEALDEKSNLLGVIDNLSNSNSSNNGNSNGETNYTKRITELLDEQPDLTNQELLDMTGIPQGSLKVIAARVRSRLKSATNN